MVGTSNQSDPEIPIDIMVVSIVMGYPKNAGWFISWKIPSVSGWFGGTPILGNLYIYPIDPNVTFESVEQLCDNQVNLNHESLPYVSLFFLIK